MKRLVSFLLPACLVASPFPPSKVALTSGFHEIDEPWSPAVAADVNDFQVKLARMEGDFIWHHHDDEDELFLVLRGEMRMRFRRPLAGQHNEDKWEVAEVDVSERELIVVPKGIEHCPCALTDSCDVVLLERSTTLNTGSAAEELGDRVHEKSRHGVSLTKRRLKRLDAKQQESS